MTSNNSFSDKEKRDSAFIHAGSSEDVAVEEADVGGASLADVSNLSDKKAVEQAKRASLMAEFNTALKENQFRMYYQPLIDLQSGRAIGMEALIRWIHPVRGFVSPVEFISIAEDLCFINKLGDWIIREVCRTMRNWADQGITVPRIAVNISPKQLQEADFIPYLVQTSADFNIDPQNITLEITENLLINHGEAITAVLRKIKSYGFYLSLDDFGTGYSALSYLKHYPFDYVKVAREFINEIVENPGDAAITNAVISMAHGMGIKVVAEGVETEAQCEFLSKNMCDYIQGYMVAKPLPEKEAGEFIAKNYSLPEGLRRFPKPSRTLLLVDDEPSILSSLKRLFRQDGYQILTANSGTEGLEIVRNHPVDVIISDQRMPEMTGVEFLRQAKQICPETLRLVLSGYTELQSITDAINEGAIYKFLTKPWNDQHLRNQILDAFKQKELLDDNIRLGLEIRTANQELATANRHLKENLQIKERQLNIGEISLDLAREALRYMPIPALGIDSDGMIAFSNIASEVLFSRHSVLLGEEIDQILPDFTHVASGKADGVNFSLAVPDFDYVINVRTITYKSKPGGRVITFLPKPR